MISIRRRLLLWSLPALLVTGLLASIATYFEARDEIDELSDQHLRQMALTLLRQTPQPNDTLQTTPTPPDPEEESHLATQIWDKNGNLIYSGMSGSPMPLYLAQGLTTINWRDQPWRIYATRNDKLTVQVAQPMHARQEITAEIALQMLTPIAVLIPVLAVVIWIAIGQGLLPLRRLTRELGRRNAHSLQPLPVDSLPLEIQPLVTALNDLLRRLDGALTHQRQFIADAAHELRTPLTAVSLQAQIVERAQNSAESVAAMHTLKLGIARAIHLVQQLLTMARLEPEAAQRPFIELDLETLAKQVLTDYAPLAIVKNIDCGVAHSKAANIMGDADNLRILLGNLIDNAIHYTPAGGRIDVSIHTAHQQVFLEIQDNGCGIPAEERTRVFDRFYRRMGNNAPGSGLGLAIVKRIAEHHRAEIMLDEGIGHTGLKVTLKFPISITQPHRDG
jgi:two-component system OmpR family sensor kinase